MDNPTNMHSLRRTNPFGEKFIGTCVLCGQQGLPMSAMNTECPNQRGLTQDEALIEVLEDTSPAPETTSTHIGGLKK